jgi:hypothetical protein
MIPAAIIAALISASASMVNSEEQTQKEKKISEDEKKKKIMDNILSPQKEADARKEQFLSRFREAKDQGAINKEIDNSEVGKSAAAGAGEVAKNITQNVSEGKMSGGDKANLIGTIMGAVAPLMNENKKKKEKQIVQYGGY